MGRCYFFDLGPAVNGMPDCSAYGLPLGTLFHLHARVLNQ